MKSDELPVILKAYDLARVLTRRTAKLPRDVKFVLGDRILGAAYQLLESLIRAKYSKNKQEILSDCNLMIELLRFQIRLCYDEKYINEKQYAYLCGQLLETGRMTGGWLKSISN